MTSGERKSRILKKIPKRKLFTIAMALLGNLLYASAVKFFLIPTGLVTGGTTGIALAVNHATGCKISYFVLIFNVLMLILGYLVLGKKFALTTVFCTFAYPIVLEGLNIVFGDVVLTDDIVLNTIFSGILTGLSLGIVIRSGASTGGMDIPPLILNHYFNIPISVTMYLFDFVILLFQAMFQPVDKVLYGILLVLVYTVVLDKLMLMGTTRTEVKVVSKKYEEIRQAILSEIDRGVTLIDVKGGYQGKESQMIYSVISNRELPKLEKVIHEIDSNSFMVINRVSEVRGRGFTKNKKYKFF